MNVETAIRIIEAGHIAHDGLPQAYLEFGKDEARKIYTKVQFVSKYGEGHALEGLIRAIREHPEMQADHLFWRKKPTIVPVEGWDGYVRAYARLLTANRFDVNVDVSRYPAESEDLDLGMPSRATTTYQEVPEEE